MEKEGARSVEATVEAQTLWRNHILKMNENTLFPFTKSWWTGGNVPGRPSETVTFIEGIESYEKIAREKLATWDGFEIKAAG
jgi:hypothetical protein